MRILLIIINVNIYRIKYIINHIFCYTNNVLAKHFIIILKGMKYDR